VDGVRLKPGTKDKEAEVNEDKPHVDILRVLAEVQERRQKQDIKHGGPAHDDEFHPDPTWWCLTISDYNAKAMACHFAKNPEGHRDYLLDVAALAVAAVERIDREKARG
jgi:hypothetical protein